MTETASILVAEDDELTRELLVKVLRRDGHLIYEAADGAQALAVLDERVLDLVVSDVQMAHTTGMQLLERVNAATPDTPVILVTAYADPGAAMDAISRGAADYLAKPIDIIALRSTVNRALERRRLTGENRRLRSQAAGRKELIGTSPAMLEVYKTIAHVAPTNASVLITGESGSGKELVARTIHERSLRAKGPFVAVNCGALAESLLEAELFGHERGAFTGAHAARRGLFEEAHGGTILLDEVGDVPPKMQVQLLRVLQEGEIRRVGGRAAIAVDVRVLAATNRDLEEDVASGRMRSDLFYRLNVVHLWVPPLRDRGDDVVALAHQILARHALTLGREVPEIGTEAMTRLRAHRWPGNVRELENALARAAALSKGPVLLPSDLPPLAAEDGEPAQAIDADWPTLDVLERRYVERMLQRSGDNKTEAARLLGIDRRTLQRLLARWGKGEAPDDKDQSLDPLVGPPGDG